VSTKLTALFTMTHTVARLTVEQQTATTVAVAIPTVAVLVAGLVLELK
jgi:hypothetical protein